MKTRLALMPLLALSAVVQAAPPKLTLPPALAPELQAIGAEDVRALAISPDRAQLVEVSATQIKAPGWSVSAPSAVAFVTFSADGGMIGVLGRAPDANHRLLVLASKTGAVVGDWTFDLPTPQIERGIQPPAHPTGLLAHESGFRVVNAYGTYAVGPGGATKLAPDGDGSRTGQDGVGRWDVVDRGLRRTDTGVVTEMPCRAQAFAVDSGLDRAALFCVSAEGNTYQWVTLSTGKSIATYATPGRPQHLIILDADRFRVVEAAPAAVATYGPQPARQAQSVGWSEIGLTPTRARAVGVGYGGEFEVIGLPDGAVLCDHVRAGTSVLSAGFADEGTLWALSYRPGVFNALDLVQIDVARCVESKRFPLALGKTTNLLPRWVPAAQGFVLNALRGQDYGLLLVRVSTPAAPEWLAQARTPQFVVSEEGGRIGWVDDGHCGLATVGKTTAIATAQAAECAYIALPAGHTLTYGYKVGWQVDGRVAFDSPQPQQVMGAQGHLFITDYARLLQVDFRRARVVRVWQFDKQAPRFVLLDAGHGLLGGGSTGWQLLSVPAGD